MDRDSPIGENAGTATENPMFERLFGSRTTDPASASRVPPGQYLTEKRQVLHYGSVPTADLAAWDLRVHGLVGAPLTFTWDQFLALPRTRVTADIHLSLLYTSDAADDLLCVDLGGR